MFLKRFYSKQKRMLTIMITGVLTIGTFFPTHILAKETPSIWESVPLITKEMKENSNTNSEGCQWGTYISYDPVEGKLAFMGTDVGGLYYSKNGGKTWAPSTLGFGGYGATSIICDPNNINHVICVGTNAGKNSGLYSSYNGGDSWEATFFIPLTTHHDFRQQIAFDESSTTSNGYSKYVYWVTEKLSKEAYSSQGIYRSCDGGNTFSLLENSNIYANSQIACTKNGTVYILTDSGDIFVSFSHGETWTKISDTANISNIHSIKTIRTMPDTLYFLGNNGIGTLTCNSDNTLTAKVLTTSIPEGASKYADFLAVSPANPNHMMLQFNSFQHYKSPSTKGYYDMTSYYSTDGGKTWGITEEKADGIFSSCYARCEKVFSFHPTDENRVLSLGGNCIMMSTNSGATLTPSNTGFNAVYVGGKINFNPNNPNLISIASQDFNGAYSTDGGETWTYLPWSGKSWGGFCYGSYSINDTTIVSSLSDKWTSQGGIPKLVVTYDGGKTITRTNKEVTGSLIGCGVFGANHIAFFGEWKTTDSGKTWTKMKDCTGVFTQDYQSKRLFGYDKNTEKIVYSDDNGDSFFPISNQSFQGVTDIAYNPSTKKLYVATFSLNVYDFHTNTWSTVKNLNMPGAKGVCVDYSNPSIMYACFTSNNSYTQTTVVQSTDSGATWHPYTRAVGDGLSGPDGANQAMNCRVNAKTGELWVTTHCCGIWKRKCTISQEAPKKENQENNTTPDHNTPNNNTTPENNAPNNSTTPENSAPNNSVTPEDSTPNNSTTPENNAPNNSTTPEDHTPTPSKPKQPTKPKKTSLVKLSRIKNGKIKVSWKKQTQITGYQITYSYTKNFKKTRTVTIKNAKSTSCILTVPKKKNLYIKVRTYRYTKGKKSYSPYSSVKKIYTSKK